MSNQNLGTVITDPATRRVIYAVYVIALVIVGAVSAGFAAVGAAFPAWLVATTAVVTYLGIPVGGLAVANTPKPEEKPEETP